MSAVLAPPGSVGFVASELSLCDELGVAARHCAVTNSLLVVSSADAVGQCALLRSAHPGLDMIADTRYWAKYIATPDEPTEASGMLGDLDMWAETMLQDSGAQHVIAPTGFIRLGEINTFAAVLADLGRASHPRLLPFVATDAQVLTPRYLPEFLEVVGGSKLQHLIFLFAQKGKPLASYARLSGVRTLLSCFPGIGLVGVDVLVGTDAIAHGAGWVAVGASSSRRWPRRPGDDGGGPLAAGFLPGSFLRELLEMRSPAIYSDWYANSRSPMCRICNRSFDSYMPTPLDKACIIQHNMHAIRDFATEMTVQPVAERAAWLDRQRVQALVRHTRLTSTGALVDADLTLRRLCELDDPQMRETTREGIWH